MRQHHGLPDPGRLPPTSLLPALRIAPQRLSEPPPVLTALPPSAGFQPEFAHGLPRARLRHRAGYSPECRSRRLLVDFCSCLESGARPRLCQNSPTSDPLPERSCLTRRQDRVPSEGQFPCGSYPPSCCSPGVRTHRLDARTPDSPPVAWSVGFTPTHSSSGTPCHPLTSDVVWKRLRRTTVRSHAPPREEMTQAILPRREDERVW